MNADAFSVQVIGCSELVSDCPLKNVGVRVSLASISTGLLLKKKDMSKQVISQYEKSPYIPQFTTRGINCSKLTASSALWNETFIVNENPSVLFNQDTIMLFEIIDFTIHKKKHFFNSVAFAFLKVKSADGHSKNINKMLKLQLYEYPKDFNSTVIGTSLPAVSLLQSKNPINATLTVEIDEIVSTEVENVEDRPENVFQKEVSARSLDELLDSEAGLSNLNLSETQYSTIRPASQIPRYLNAQIPAGEHGALCLTFNRAGTVLAAAIQSNNEFYVYLYETVNFHIISYFPAHIDLIYELAFSKDDRRLLSVSSDGTARVWNSDGSPKAIATLATTSYQYTGKFNPLDSNIIATAGYDGIIRIWDVKRRKIIQKLSQHKIRINSLVFSPNGKQLFAGDALGMISVWNVNVDLLDSRSSSASQSGDSELVTFQKMVVDNEIKNTCITNLSMGRSNLSLLVTTQDNFVRNFETRIMVVSQRYFGINCSKYLMKASFSPDSKFIFAGSENGSICIWNVKENEQVNVIEWTHKFKNPVTSMAWNHKTDMCAFSSFGDGEPILIYKAEKATKAARKRPLPNRPPIFVENTASTNNTTIKQDENQNANVDNYTEDTKKQMNDFREYDSNSLEYDSGYDNESNSFPGSEGDESFPDSDHQF